MNFLADLVMKLVIWLHALTKQDISSEDAKKQSDLKSGLLDRVREHERELRESSDLRPHGEPVRLAESVKAKVWVVDANGKNVRSNNRITIHEGWYALPKE